MTHPSENLLSELRRGTLVLAILSQLDQQQYGYSLSQTLAEQGIEIEQSTLYPLLRRLEQQDLLESEWSTEGSRPRKYYQLSPEGGEVLKTLKEDWFRLSSTLNRILKQEE